MRLFLLLIITVSLPAFSQDTIPQQHAKATHAQNKGDDTANHNPPNTQVVYLGAPGQNGDVNETSKTSKSKQHAQQWWERPTVTDWILAVTTIAYVFVNLFILLSLKRQTGIATKSANALALAERAWVIVTVEPQEGPNADSRLSQVCVANYGRTPARIISARGNLYKLDGQSVEVIPDPQANILPAMRLLAPQEKWRIQPFGLNVSQSGYSQIVPSDQAYVAYIAYRTLFDKPDDAPMKHESAMCSKLISSGKLAVPPNITSTASPVTASSSSKNVHVRLAVCCP
jgi:hypothetical protein